MSRVVRHLLPSPVRRLSRPSWSMHFGNVSQNGLARDRFRSGEKAKNRVKQKKKIAKTKIGTWSEAKNGRD